MQATKLQEAGKVDEAEVLFAKIVRSTPKNLVALYSLGVIKFQKGDYTGALSYFSRAQKINPTFAPLLFNTGLTHIKLGNIPEAVSDMEKALDSDKTYEPAKKQLELLRASVNYGNNAEQVAFYTEITRALELQAENRIAEAEAIFQEILKQDDKNILALYSLGAIEQQRGMSDRALAYFEQGVSAKPDYAPMWFSRGVALQSLKQHEKAIESFDKALEINPQYIEVLVNKGAALAELKRHRDALLNYEELLKIEPSNVRALNNRGILLSDFKMFDLAIQTYELLLKIDPDYEYALGLLAFAKLHSCDWDGIEAYCQQVTDGVRAGKRVCKSQGYLAMTGDPKDHMQCARIFADQYFPAKDPIWQGERYAHDKIRIAYISPDLREHPVGHLTAGIFEQHDKDKFEIIAISLGLDDGSRLRQRMVAAFSKFIDARQMRSQDIAQMIREMEIDIVVDLAGYTADSRTDVLAYRPAPVQVNYLGYSSTMGTDYMDYIIADRHIIPEELQECYYEEVIYMPDTYLPTDATVQISEITPTRAECCLPDDGFVFCSFNHDYKINPAIFDVWMRLLKQVPGSVLWLMKLNESAERNLVKEAVARGVEPDRIIFATRVPRIEDHLARYRVADLFLDTTPYNAHTTTSDVLRVGLPVLTCRGKSFAGRVAAGLINVVGLPELVTDSLEEYESLALHLAQHKDELSTIRAKLLKNLKTTPLYDTERYCRNLEQLYTTMWERYQQVDASGGVTVAPADIHTSDDAEAEINCRETKEAKPAICILSISNRPSISSTTQPVLLKYAQKWGYHIHFESDTLDDSRHIAWSKIKLLQRMLSFYDVCVWVDDDILITRPDTPLEEFFTEGFRSGDQPFIIAADLLPQTPINTGFMFVKNCVLSHKMLEKIWKLCDRLGKSYEPCWEQDAVNALYLYIDKNWVDVVPYRELQSFVRNNNLTADQLWRPGDFSAHFTGMELERRVQLIEEVFRNPETPLSEQLVATSAVDVNQ
jgi:predicted O-linked N-acetylglucosamine transferase (SPINDLY family)